MSHDHLFVSYQHFFTVDSVQTGAALAAELQAAGLVVQAVRTSFVVAVDPEPVHTASTVERRAHLASLARRVGAEYDVGGVTVGSLESLDSGHRSDHL